MIEIDVHTSALRKSSARRKHPFGKFVVLAIVAVVVVVVVVVAAIVVKFL